MEQFDQAMPQFKKMKMPDSNNKTIEEFVSIKEFERRRDNIENRLNITQDKCDNISNQIKSMLDRLNSQIRKAQED